MFLRKLLPVISVLVLLATLTVSADAQDDSTANTPLPDPHENMQQLSWFIGEWDIQSRLLADAETDEWLEETLQSIHTYEMGGHIILERFIGPIGGGPFEGWSIRKYNANTDQWQQRWMDTSTPFILSWAGSMTEDGEFIGYNEFFLNDEGELAGDRGAREVFFNITEDSFSWRFESTQDGGETWTVTWTLEYTRRASE